MKRNPLNYLRLKSFKLPLSLLRGNSFVFFLSGRDSERLQICGKEVRNSGNIAMWRLGGIALMNRNSLLLKGGTL
jgi:hypothetical protein